MSRGVSMEDWTTPEGLDELRGMADGTIQDIAKAIGISPRTLNRWCERSDAIRDILYDRKRCAMVEKEVYACCFDRTRKVKLRKQVIDKNGEIKELVEEKMVVLPADFRAQKYWLNNRNPDRWKDKVEVAVDATSGGMLTLPVAELVDPGDEDE